uniref:Uncharacterized protein n=1 Tax=Cyprinus carpio TaxID=7962 RepID=A0A8C2GJ18_CYPCA
MSLQKPAMRGLLAKRLRFHLPIAFGLSIIAAVAFKVSVIVDQSIFDIVLIICTILDLCGLKEAGVFESVRPTGK